MRFQFIIIAIIALFTISFRGFQEIKLKIPEGWPAPQEIYRKEILSTQKIHLGRVLFYDPILSLDSTISCASCHSPYTAFTHVDHALSHGIQDKIGTRNAPALQNLAWQPAFMWDGVIPHLDMQSIFPITHPDEMGETLEGVMKKLNHSPRYKRLFYAAYQDSIATGARMLKSLSQFMLTLISANAKYDKFMRKEIEFTEQENRGYLLYKQNCSSCHTEPLFSNYAYENNGLTIDTLLNDKGRFKVTQNPLDAYKFKVPSLRNIEFSYPYMHDGRFKTIPQVLIHYTTGIQESPTLSNKLNKVIVLSSKDKVDLTAFLLTLTDRNFFFDTLHTFPKELLQPF